MVINHLLTGMILQVELSEVLHLLFSALNSFGGWVGPFHHHLRKSEVMKDWVLKENTVKTLGNGSEEA